MGNSVSTTVAAQRQSQWRNHLAHTPCRQRKQRWLDATASNPGRFIDLGVVTSTDTNHATRRTDPVCSTNAASVEVRIELGGGMVLTIAQH